MKTKNELEVPPAARLDAKSFELMRVWIAESDMHVNLQLGGWQEPEPWGVVLADLAQHVADFYAEKRAMDRADVLDVLRTEFLRELAGAEEEES